VELHLDLKPVPKMLWYVKRLWAFNSFCVSFKLETDPSLLLSKAAAAIKNHAVDLVVANELETRYDKVIFVHPPSDNPRTTVVTKDGNQVIEIAMVENLMRFFEEFRKQKKE